MVKTENQNTFGTNSELNLSSGLAYEQPESPFSERPDTSTVETPEPSSEVPHPRRPDFPFRSQINHLKILDTDAVCMVGFHGGPQKRAGLKLALWTWFSASIDMLVLVSISCFFTVLFSFLMKTSPGSVVSLFLKNHNLGNIVTILFLITVWAYLIFMRAFMGASIGEWTCDLRLGEPVQRFEVSYLFKVILRTTVIMATGIIILPLLSVFLARDLAGDIAGIKIYSLQ